MCHAWDLVSNMSAHQEPWANQSLLCGLSEVGLNFAPVYRGPWKPMSPSPAEAGVGANTTAAQAIATRTANAPNLRRRLTTVPPGKRWSP